MSRASLAVLEPIPERDHLAQRTYTAIREAVLASSIPPGTPLSVAELARQLGVSRSPVREAVQRLIHDGLATHMRNHEAVVNQVDVDEVNDLYVVRQTLEGLAARLATEAADQRGLEDLRSITAQHRSLAPEDADVETQIDLDTRFHRAIRDLAGNHHLSEILESIVTQSHAIRRSLWTTPESAALALAEHQAIVDAMATGDPGQAETAAREHISRLRIRLRQSLPR